MDIAVVHYKSIRSFYGPNIDLLYNSQHLVQDTHQYTHRLVNPISHLDIRNKLGCIQVLLRSSKIQGPKAEYSQYITRILSIRIDIADHSTVDLHYRSRFHFYHTE